MVHCVVEIYFEVFVNKNPLSSIKSCFPLTHMPLAIKVKGATAVSCSLNLYGMAFQTHAMLHIILEGAMVRSIGITTMFHAIIKNNKS